MFDTAIRSQTAERVWRYAEGVLFGRAAGAVAAFLTVLIVLGCMTHNSFETSDQAPTTNEAVSPTDGVCIEQTGAVCIPNNGNQLVYYPIPFASPPNLVLEGDSSYCTLLEQKAACFRIRDDGRWAFGSKVTWKARGQRIAPQPGPPATVNESATLAPPPVITGAVVQVNPAPVVQLSGPGTPPPPPTPIPYTPETK